MGRLSHYDAGNLIKEHVENRTLEDILEELKMYGEITLHCSGGVWNCEYIPRVKTREYKFDNCGKDLLQLVKNCLSMVYISQAMN
jgi:hypothetical protein